MHIAIFCSKYLLAISATILLQKIPISGYFFVQSMNTRIKSTQCTSSQYPDIFPGRRHTISAIGEFNDRSFSFYDATGLVHHYFIQTFSIYAQVIGFVGRSSYFSRCNGKEPVLQGNGFRFIFMGVFYLFNYLN